MITTIVLLTTRPRCCLQNLFCRCSVCNPSKGCIMAGAENASVKSGTSAKLTFASSTEVMCSLRSQALLPNRFHHRWFACQSHYFWWITHKHYKQRDASAWYGTWMSGSYSRFWDKHQPHTQQKTLTDANGLHQYDSNLMQVYERQSAHTTGKRTRWQVQCELRVNQYIRVVDAIILL